MTWRKLLGILSLCVLLQEKLQGREGDEPFKGGHVKETAIQGMRLKVPQICQ